MRMEQRQHIQQSVLRIQAANAAPALWADRQTPACVNGTIFGRDVVPDVIRMKASLSARRPQTRR